jgi:hypothetical protein
LFSLDPVRCLVVVAVFVLSGCAADRCHYAMTHAYVSPWTHLPPAELEQVICTVSRATPQPVVGVTAHKGNPGTITVITSTSDETMSDHCTAFNLKKQNGEWRITFSGSSSDSIANGILAGGIP